MNTVAGLPAHVLLVHAVVVLIPLSAILLVIIALSPRARRPLALPALALAVLAAISVPLTTSAGEWLEPRVPSSGLVRAHTQLGDTLLPWVIGVVVLTAAVWYLDRRQRQSADVGQPGGVDPHREVPRLQILARSRTAVLVLATVSVVVALVAMLTTYRVGDSGARAAWTGQFSQETHDAPREPLAPPP